MKIFVGTSGYSYKEWQGKFYPAKISPREMLRFYAERLTAVEINNTFYHMPREAVLASWVEQVPGGFFVYQDAIRGLRRKRPPDENRGPFL